MPLYRSVLCYSWGVFNIRLSSLKLSIMIVLVSISLLLIQVKTLYALSNHGILSDNSTSPNPSVLRLSPAPLNGSNSVLPSSTSSTPTGPKSDTNTTDHGTTTGSFPTHGGTNIDSASTISSTSTHTDHQKKDSDSGLFAQKIISKIKQKFKVGDIPFP